MVVATYKIVKPDFGTWRAHPVYIQRIHNSKYLSNLKSVVSQFFTQKSSGQEFSTDNAFFEQEYGGASFVKRPHIYDM